MGQMHGAASHQRYPHLLHQDLHNLSVTQVVSASRMTSTAIARAVIGRGLGRTEPDGDVMVLYAAKHGTIAEDGAGATGPLAAALLEHLPTPALDVRLMFGRVRDGVKKATGGRQEPFLYGSLGGTEHYFLPPN